MTENPSPTGPADLGYVRKRAESDARTYGYYLHPDPDFLSDLVAGIKKNWDRYGYPSCPCRLASGVFEYDRDIFCPCDYRDPDVAEFGTCYCGLYVRKDLYEGRAVPPIPERRPPEKIERAFGAAAAARAAKPTAKSRETGPSQPAASVKKRFWYCRQCGYVIFREDPPYVCPICKARREFFAEIEMPVKPLNR